MSSHLDFSKCFTPFKPKLNFPGKHSATLELMSEDYIRVYKHPILSIAIHSFTQLSEPVPCGVNLPKVMNTDSVETTLKKTGLTLWWVGVDCGGLEWTVVGWSGLWWVGVDCGGLEWTVVGWSGLWWVGVACGGLEWPVVGWSGLGDPTGQGRQD